MTPLGSPVVPELYMTRQTSSSPTSPDGDTGEPAASQASYSSSPEEPTTITVDTAGRSSSPAVLAKSSPTKSTLAPQSVRMYCSSLADRRKLAIACDAPSAAAANVIS